MGEGSFGVRRSACGVGVAWLLAIGCWLLADGAMAEEAAKPAPVGVEMSASPATVAMGGTITVTVRYRWPRGWRVAGEPNPSRDFAEQFVTAAPPPVASHAGDEERRAFTLSVCPTRSGAWELPRPEFAAAPAEGGEPSRARAEPVVVQVGVADKPVDPPAARPLVKRPPADLEQRRRAWWISAGIGALLLVTAVLALRARRRAGAAAPTPREILARELAEAGRCADGKEAGARIGLALRRFAGSVWDFDGAGSTAREAANAVRSHGPDDEARELARLLESLEAVRWAPDALVASALAPLIDGGSRWGDAVQRRLDAEREAAERERRAGRPANAKDEAKAKGAA